MSRPKAAVEGSLPRTYRRKSDAPVTTTEWWKLPDKELHSALIAAVDACAQRQSERKATLEHHWRLYSNRPFAGLTTPQGLRRPMPNVSPGRLAINVVRSCVDTATAKIAKARPKPKFLTSDGEGALQRKAKWLTQYVVGTIEDSGLHREAQGAFRDACLFDFGCVYLYWDEDADGQPRLMSERVLPWEVHVDDQDGHYGKPKQIRREAWRYPSELEAIFPGKAKEIRAAATSTRRGSTNPVGSWGAGMVRVIEAWRLPSAAGKTDGKHAIAIDGCTLFSEAYEASYHPFLFFRWTDDVFGFGGGSLAEILSPLQRIINRQCRDIDEAQRLMACPRIVVDGSGKVNYSQLRARRDEIPVINVQAGGRPPTFMTANAMPAEMYQSLERNVQRAYELSGISQLTAQAQKPGGLDSGAAIREYADAASERFALTSQRWDDLFVQAARMIVDMSRRKHEQLKGAGKRIRVKGTDGDFLRQLSWKDVCIDDDKYSIGVYPTPALLGTPAAQTQTVIEWMQAGLIPREHALSLLNFPDLQAFASLDTAALKNAQREIERILDEGKPGEVDDFADHALCVKMGMAASLNAQYTHEPERVELLRRWTDEHRRRMQEQPQQGQPANDNGAPPAGGGGVSPDGLPVVPGAPNRAYGGPVAAGKPYVVGERGPEVIVPGSDGTVVPNSAGNADATTATAVTALAEVANKLADLVGKPQGQQAANTNQQKAASNGYPSSTSNGGVASPSYGSTANATPRFTNGASSNPSYPSYPSTTQTQSANAGGSSSSTSSSTSSEQQGGGAGSQQSPSIDLSAGAQQPQQQQPDRPQQQQQQAPSTPDAPQQPSDAAQPQAQAGQTNAGKKMLPAYLKGLVQSDQNFAGMTDSQVDDWYNAQTTDALGAWQLDRTMAKLRTDRKAEVDAQIAAIKASGDAYNAAVEANKPKPGVDHNGNVTRYDWNDGKPPSADPRWQWDGSQWQIVDKDNAAKAASVQDYGDMSPAAKQEQQAQRAYDAWIAEQRAKLAPPPGGAPLTPPPANGSTANWVYDRNATPPGGDWFWSTKDNPPRWKRVGT